MKEETGLIVKDIIYKGLEENCDPNQRVRHMIFNYLATSFEGNAAGPSSGGRIVMVDKDQALNLPMQSWFKRRFPLFFIQGTFELHSVWDEHKQTLLSETKKEYEVIVN